MRRLLAAALLLVACSARADDVEDAVKLLKSKKPADRTKALESLGKSGEKAKAASAAVIDALMEKYPAGKEEYFETLEKINPSVAKQLITLLVDQDESKKLDAVEAIKGLKDDGQACVTVLLLYHDANRAKGFVRNAIIALDAVVTVSPDDKRVVQAVVKSVGDVKSRDTSMMRKPAIEAARKMRIDPKLLVPALMAATTDPHADFGSPITFTIETLGSLGTDAKAALPTLNKLKFDSNSEIRDAAAAAIKKIAP